MRIYLALAIAIFVCAYGWHRSAHNFTVYKAQVEQQVHDAQVKAAADTKQWQDAANTAGVQRDDALKDLSQYRAAHPVSVRLCPKPASVPADPVSHPTGGETAPVLQQDTADIGPALDSLMAEADSINENYRACKADYDKVSGH